jgi:hypothetical protein
MQRTANAAPAVSSSLHHGVTELLTADRDFGRPPELKTRKGAA